LHHFPRHRIVVNLVPATVRKERSSYDLPITLGVIVTEDLSKYKIVLEKLQLGHQVCQFHVRHWVGRTLKELQEIIPKEWLWMLQLLDVLFPDGSQRLHAR
jgi:predicted ATPase with chaperone activity